MDSELQRLIAESQRAMRMSQHAWIIAVAVLFFLVILCLVIGVQL